MSNRLDDIPSQSGFQTGTPRITLPFLNYPTSDKHARIIERDWSVIPANYVSAVGNRTSYTNYLTYSEAFDNAAWTATNVTVTADAIANPGDGTVSADSILETVTNGEHRVAQAYTFTAVAHTVSVFAKANGRNFIRIRANDGSTDFTAFFNLSTGTTGTVGAGVTASILQVGSDGWYRCRITFTPAASAGNVYVNTSSDGSTISYAGSTSAGVYLFGAQVERASSAGPYISTTSTSRTISAPDMDPGDTVNPADPFAYLVEESTPVNINTVARANYVRKWARVPKQQVTYSSRAITKPTIANQWVNPAGASATQLFTEYNATNISAPIGTAPVNQAAFFCTDNRVFYPLKSPAANPTAQTGTGGTFTVTYKTSTTAPLAYNVSNAAAAAAINALASVVSDGITVSVSNSFSGGTLFQITISAGPTSTMFSVNTSSLTTNIAGPPTNAYLSLGAINVQNFQLAYVVTVTGHGFSAVASILLGYGGTSPVAWIVSSWDAYDANTLRYAPPGGTTSATLLYVAPYLRTYTPGTSVLTSRITETFYLTGVTSGVSTAADIPLTSPNLSDADIIAAVLNNTGYQPVGFEGPAQWLGPIYRSAQTDINFDLL